MATELTIATSAQIQTITRSVSQNRKWMGVLRSTAVLLKRMKAEGDFKGGVEVTVAFNGKAYQFQSGTVLESLETVENLVRESSNETLAKAWDVVMLPEVPEALAAIAPKNEVKKASSTAPKGVREGGVMGQSACAVIRWAARNNFTRAQVRQALETLSTEAVSDVTINCQFHRANKLAPADLTAEQVAKFTKAAGATTPVVEAPKAVATPRVKANKRRARKAVAA